MVYMYVDEWGNVAHATTGPTQEDLKMVETGVLSVVRVDGAEVREIDPLDGMKWVEVPHSPIAKTTEGNEYHHV